MIDSALISVALCTYNGEKYIEVQLQSILNQTYQNLEIIIVDDCSTDNTVFITENYATKDTRIKLFKNQQNLGFNKNFEKAIKLTTGNFIAISDQDDIWDLQKLELLLKNIGHNWLIFSNSSYINENGIIDDKKLLKNFFTYNKTYKTILLNNWVTGHTTLFKREFLNYIMPFPENGFYDWWIGFVALYHNQIKYLDQILTLYRIHADSVIQQSVQLQHKDYKKQQLDATISMHTAFIHYKLMADADQRFVTTLQKALIFKKKYHILTPLIKMIYTNYDDFYPDRKKRAGFSKLNFCYKISKEF